MRRVERLSLALAAVLFVAHASLFLQPFEDSYITYRYARNLALGRGLVYNVGERVEGFTSFGWTILLAAFAKLGADITVVAPFLSVAFGVVAVVLSGVLARKTDRPFAVVVAPLVATSGTFAYYAASGMETSAFLATLLAGVVLLLADGRRGHLAAGALIAVACSLRPEGPGYAVVIFASLLSARETRARAVRSLVVFAVIFGPWFVWRAVYFGYPFPNTYYAKASPSLGRFVAGATYLEAFLTLHLWWLVVPAIVIVIRRRGLVPWVRVGVAVIGAAAVNAIVVGGDTFVYWRFLLPAVPFAMLFVADAVLAWPIARAAPALVFFGAMQGAASFVPQRSLLARDARSAWTMTRRVATVNADYFRIGAFLARSFPPETTIAVDAAGIIPYGSDLPTLDMLGLNDVHIAHRKMPRIEGATGHEKHDAAYVLSRAPDIVLPGLPTLIHHIPKPDEIGPWFGRWFPFIPGDRELLEKPAFRQHYKVAVAEVDDGAYLIFFQRIEAPAAP